VHRPILEAAFHGKPGLFARCTIAGMSKLEIAAAAAQLVVQEGLEYGAAKHRALRQLGLPQRTALPGNHEVENAVREHLALFCADTQPSELRALRGLARDWMERLASFRPHLSGAVWHGTATRRSDIYIQLFCDEQKILELALIDKGVHFEVQAVTGMHGAPVEVLSINEDCRELKQSIGIHLMVYDLDDLRGALKPDAKNRSPRGDLNAVRRLLSDLK
jgi:hypothetical protein